WRVSEAGRDYLNPPDRKPIAAAADRGPLLIVNKILLHRRGPRRELLPRMKLPVVMPVVLKRRWMPRWSSRMPKLISNAFVAATLAAALIVAAPVALFAQSTTPAKTEKSDKKM